MTLDIVTFDVLEVEDASDGSFERARDTPAEVAPDHAGDSYLVAFEDGDDVHQVDLSRHPNGWLADCWALDDDNGDRTGRCRGFAFHDGPCAHLWAVRSHVAAQKLTDDDRRHDLDIEQAVADGGNDQHRRGGRRR